MNKIQRTSRYFRWLFQAAFIALSIGYLIFWTESPNIMTVLNDSIVVSFIPHGIKILHTLPYEARILGFIIGLIPLGITLAILLFLIRLFQLYEKGCIFTLDNVHYIKKIGLTMLIGQFVHPVYQALQSVNLTWHNPLGQRVATISFSGTNLGLILTAVLIILISWIMSEAHKLNEDRRLTI